MVQQTDESKQVYMVPYFTSESKFLQLSADT